MTFSLKSISVPVLAFTLTGAVMAQSPAPPAGGQRTSPTNPVPGSSIVVVVDTSAQHPSNFGEIRKAASQFVESVGEDREIAVVAASEKPALVADFDSDSEQLMKRMAD